jgi:hypothetical protein
VTGLLELPAGYRRGPGCLPAGSELLVLSGTLRIGDALRAAHFYEYTPGNGAQQRLTVEEAATVLLRSAAEPVFEPLGGEAELPGRIALETNRIPWGRSTVPGPPPALFSKTLRHDPETGERVFLSATVRRYEYDCVEFHDCCEEAFQISGDMRIGTSGLMTPGSYFWRPPYISHGPFYSRSGMVALMTIDGPLVNHYVDDPLRSVEDNRAQAQAAGPPPDHYAESRRAAAR